LIILVDRLRAQMHLLNLLAPERPIDIERACSLDGGDWDSLLHMARQHRLSPLLHKAAMLRTESTQWPDRVADACARAYRAAQLRGLAVRREILLTSQILDAAGIAHVMLKGAALVFGSYQDPGLRPLRDIDLLVRPDRAKVAEEALLAHSKSPRAAEPSAYHHLPPITSPSGLLPVEIHLRSLGESGLGAAEVVRLDEMIWTRSILRRGANQSMRLPSPHDLLLHLILHAIGGHGFNNGPLLLSDMAALASGKDAIDWAAFWRTARDLGQIRACMLACRLLETFWAEGLVAWSALGDARPVVPDEIVAHAGALMLRDFPTRSDATRYAWLVRRTGGRPSLARIIFAGLRKIGPIPALESGRFSDTRLVRACCGFLSSAQNFHDEVVISDAGHLVAVESWLLQA
jgi:hypothetical protein